MPIDDRSAEATIDLDANRLDRSVHLSMMAFNLRKELHWKSSTIQSCPNESAF